MVISLSLYGTAQDANKNYGIQRITTEIQQLHPGISQNSIRCIFQDHKGLLWLGTWDGLNRYDGIRFKIIRMAVGNSSLSLSNSTINAINQDQSHHIWVGTDGGVNCFSYQNLRRVQLDFKKNTSLSTDTIHAIHIDAQNQIWLGSQKGLGIINAARDSLKLLSEATGIQSVLDHIEIRQILQFEPSKIWVGTASGLFLVNLEDKTVRHWNLSTLSDLHLTSLNNYKDSLLFIGTENGLNILNITDYSMSSHYLFPEYKTEMGSNVVLSSIVYSDSSLLVGVAAQGMFSFDFQTKEFSPFIIPVTDNQNQNYFNPQEEDVTSLLIDSYRNIWMGTAWNGLVRISSEPVLFKNFRKNQNSSKGLNDNRIWSFLYEENKLWVGTESGINIYNFETHQVDYLDKQSGLSSDKVRSIFKDSKGRYWIGTLDNGVNLIHPDGKMMQFSSTDSNAIIANNTVWNINEDLQGNIWISSFGGISRVDKNMKAKFFQHNPNDSNSLSSNTVYSSTVDQLGRMWVSTYRGLNLFNESSQLFKRYLHQENDSNSLSTNKIFKVYDDKNGNLWIATIGGGLNKMDLATGKVQWFTTEDGLPNNVIYSLIDDGLGFIWMSSNNGICRFNKETNVINSYTVADGLQSAEFNFGADLIDVNNNIYFGGMRGFNVFNPEVIHQSMLDAPLAITEIKTMQSGSYFDFDFDDTLELAPNDNFFDIDFSKLNFKQTQKEIFRYRLINYNSNWTIQPAGIATASYSNIPAGTYYFVVQSANADGAWNDETYQLTIIVKEYWYLSWWFRISVMGLAMLMTIWIIRIRFQRLKFKNEALQQIHNLERQSLRLQMNPHFIFNTLNSIQSYILNNKAEESISYLSKFSKLMRSILINSSESIIPLQNEIEMLKHYLTLEQLRFNHCFDFEIIIAKNLDLEFIGIPSMLIQPFVENAIIHGVAPLKDKKGQIKIDFQIIGDQIHCAIEDNGVGRSFHQKNNEHSHQPKGMHITQKRLELFNKSIHENKTIEVSDLMDINGNPMGTKIHFIINFENLND